MLKGGTRNIALEHIPTWREVKSLDIIFKIQNKDENVYDLSKHDTNLHESSPRPVVSDSVFSIFFLVVVEVVISCNIEHQVNGGK